MKKRLISILAIVLLLSACGNKDTNNDANNGNPDNSEVTNTDNTDKNVEYADIKYYTEEPAIVIDGVEYTAAEVDVFYQNTFNNLMNAYYNQLGEYIYYIIDFSTPLSEQNYSEDMTWAELIFDETKRNMAEITEVYKAATEANYTLSDDILEEIENQISEMKNYVSEQGEGTFEEYLENNFGHGVTEDTYRSVLTKIITAQEYTNYYIDGKEFAEEELEAYYQEHKSSIDVITLGLYVLHTSDTIFDSYDEDAKKEALLETANKLAESTDIDDLKSNVDEVYGIDSNVLMFGIIDNIESSYPDVINWIESGNRKTNDTYIFETDDGAVVAMYINRDDGMYNVVNMRHILIMENPDEDENYTYDTKAETENKITEIYNKWLTNPTEEYFGELANQYSEDPGSNTNGGLYENVYNNQMIQNINTFLFDAERQSGDAQLIYSGTDSGYRGWHIVYYVGAGETFRYYLAKALMKDEAYSNWISEITEGSEVIELDALKYADIN